MSIKLALVNFDAIKVGKVADKQTILLEGKACYKLYSKTRTATCRVLEIETGKEYYVAPHLLCFEVDLEVTVRIKRK